MKINTIQLIKNEKLEIPNVIDITVKSAFSKLGKFFAPTWDMVNRLHDVEDEYDWFQYEVWYNNLMYDRILNDKNSVLTFLTKNYKELILGCYCQESQNCHRNLAKTIIEEYCEFIGINVEKGEFIK